MTRNNADRLPQAGNPPPTPPQFQKKAQLDFPSQTEFVDLPSKGLFYSPGHPLSEGAIEIRFMTAKDEDILSSQALIKRGIVIDRLLQNIIIDQRIQVHDLYVGDRDAIMVKARITGYGADYDVQLSCPNCDTQHKITFDLEKATHEELPDLSALDVEEKDGVFYLELPRSQVTLGVRPMFLGDENWLAESAKMNKKRGREEALLTNQFRRIIVSVQGSTDPNTIGSFIESMPAWDAKHLRALYKTIMPSVEMKHWFSCNDCSYEEEVEVPITVGFFWPK